MNFIKCHHGNAQLNLKSYLNKKGNKFNNGNGYDENFINDSYAEGNIKSVMNNCLCKYYSMVVAGEKDEKRIANE